MHTIIPEECGFSSARLNRMSTVMQRYVEAGQLAGLIAMVGCRDRIVYLNKFGYMNVEAGKAMQFDTLFQVASMTKAVTAVAAMMLYEEGYFDLNTPVYTFIPSFKTLKVLARQTDNGLELVDLELKGEGRRHLLDGIPKYLPALLRASRIGEKAASVGFDWRNPEEVRAKIVEEAKELVECNYDPVRLEEEFGDLLFALTSMARHLKIDAESSLRLATEKFESRFRWMEEEVVREGKELAGMSAKELDELWNLAKKAVRSSPQ